MNPPVITKTRDEALALVGTDMESDDKRPCRVVGVDCQEPKSKRMGLFWVLRPLFGDSKWLRKKVD